MFIYGDKQNEIITFKLYDHSTDTEYATDYMLKYKIGAVEYITVNFNSYIPKIKIETTPYQTLEVAVAAAQDGQTISVLRDIVDKGVIINKNITIDFGGFTYNINEGVGSADAEHNGFLIQNNCEVALKNGSLNVNEDDADKLNVLIHNYADLTVTDMTLDGKFLDLSTAEASYVISNKSGTVNLIGNPYTHNITLAHITGADLVDGFYTLTNEGAWNAKTSSDAIGACQGVLVKTMSEADVVIHEVAPTKRTLENDNGMLTITVSNETYSDVAYASFNKGLGLDKIGHRNMEIPMVYIPVDGVNYAVAMVDMNATEIPVSFEAMTMGEYSISAEARDCEFDQIILVDRFTGEETDLLHEDYSFIASSKDKSERFVIRLAASAASADDNFAYVNNDMLIINKIAGQGVVSVYDVAGRNIAEYKVSDSANIPLASLRKGVYLIQMSDASGIKVQKIIID